MTRETTIQASGSCWRPAGVPGAVVLVLLAGLLAGAAAHGASGDLRVETVSGRVEIGSGEPPVFRPAREGMALAPGEVVRTGPGGRAALELDGRTVRLYENTLLRLPSRFDGDDHEVGLDEGRSLFDVTPGRNVPFRVRTPEVVVSVKGTRFLVDAGRAGGVSVFRGLVEVANALETAEGPGLLVREGFAAVGGGSVPLELLMQDVADPWESWSEGGAAPTLPGAETLESARTILEQAIVGEIERLDPTLLATPEPEPTARVEPTVRTVRERQPPGLDPDARLSAQPPASLRDAVRELPEPLTPELDPVADVARSGLSASQPGSGTSALLSAILAGSSGAGSGLAGDDRERILRAMSDGDVSTFPFTIDVLSNEELILGFGDDSVRLDDDDIDALEDGDFQSLGPLLQVIDELGLDRDAVTEILDDLI